MSWSEMTHPDDLRADEVEFNRVLAGESEGYSIDKRFIRKDRQIVYATISVKCVRRADGSIDFFVGLLQDITERKRAEEEVRVLNAALERRVLERTAQLEAANAEIESTTAARQRIEEQQGLAIEAADLGVWIWDIAGDRLVWSPRVYDLLGLAPPVPLSHATFLAALHPDDRERVDRSVARAVADRSDYRAEYRVVWPDGSAHWLSSMGRTTYDERGEAQHITGVVLDITDRKRTEEAIAALHLDLERRTAQLEVANRELEAFGHSVSHDLRAPLRHIEGFSHALLEEYGARLEPEGRRYLDRIRYATSHMGQLIEDLLDLSRVTRADMVADAVNLSELAGAIAGELQSSEPGRQVQFVIEPGLIADGDARLLRVALENLFANAWKYTSKHPTARIEFGATSDGDGHVEYVLRDDGAGFDMARAERLFGPFQRLHGAAEFEGTGIGLATVQRIIHRHGGRIWAEAAVEKGATFHFTLAPRAS
jgi:PAS domain S-box-containing protein